jgi:hypothetical protein
MTETRIGELLKDLDKALGELKHRSKKSLTTRAGAKVSSPRRTAIIQRIEPEIDDVEKVLEEELVEEVEEAEEPEENTTGQGMRLETYETPEGYVIKKSRM